ncbi:MAG: hypothetical protein ACU833_04555 [Gammaproteobacteria bacterium]
MTALNSEEESTLSEKRKFQLEEGILIVLLILSLVGIGITDFSPAESYWYWIIMIFVFGLFAILLGWLESKKQARNFKKLFLEQSLHWGSSMLIVGGVFLLLHSGKLDSENSGLVILLILALATILDGLRVGWRFSMTGLFLGISAVIAGHFEQSMWIHLLLAIVIVLFTILVEYLRNKRALKRSL